MKENTFPVPPTHAVPAVEPPAADHRRFVALEGAVNARDLGGYPTRDGGTVRWGLLYRSAGLHRLTPADLATLAGLGLRVVIDLRTPLEQEKAPSVLPAGVRRVPLPIGGEAARSQELAEAPRLGDLATLPADFLQQVAVTMTEGAARTFGQFLTLLAEDGATPALFHCHFGKDRTGLAAALLLSALGVDEAAILDDYELSRNHHTERQLARLMPRLEAAGLTLEQYNAVFGAPRHAMASTVAAIRDRHGTVVDYLLARAGVTEEVIAALRERLVTPAARP